MHELLASFLRYLLPLTETFWYFAFLTDCCWLMYNNMHYDLALKPYVMLLFCILLLMYDSSDYANGWLTWLIFHFRNIASAMRCDSARDYDSLSPCCITFKTNVFHRPFPIGVYNTWKWTAVVVVVVEFNWLALCEVAKPYSDAIKYYANQQWVVLGYCLAVRLLTLVALPWQALVRCVCIIQLCNKLNL